MITLIVLMIIIIMTVSVMILLIAGENSLSVQSELIDSDEMIHIDQDLLIKKTYECTRNFIESNIALSVYNPSLIKKKYGYIGIMRGETYYYDIHTKNIAARMNPAFN